MSASEPHPEPLVSPRTIHYISLPIHSGIGPRPGGRTYVVWRADSCPEGPLHYAGIHTGLQGIAWEGLRPRLGPEGYQPGVCRLRRVNSVEGRDILSEAERLFWSEAAVHRLPTDFAVRLFVWYRESVPEGDSPRRERGCASPPTPSTSASQS
eukprot:6490817-Amphidinium_carterae.2